MLLHANYPTVPENDDDDRDDRDPLGSTPTAVAPPADVVHVECHYCGYEPHASSTPAAAAPPRVPARCPKCGGSAWDSHVAPGRLLIRGASQTVVRFVLHYPAQRAYVLGNFGDSRLVEMTRTDRADWQAVVLLPAGDYRYRFYVEDHGLLHYVGADGTPMQQGFDQRFVLPETPDGRRRRRAAESGRPTPRRMRESA
jgi:hypothetical protein